MKRPPPYLIRRLVIAPLFVVGAVLALTSIPLWLLIAAFASRFVPGHWRILRVAWFLFLYVGLEAFMLVVLFVTWVATGFSVGRCGRHDRRCSTTDWQVGGCAM